MFASMLVSDNDIDTLWTTCTDRMRLTSVTLMRRKILNKAARVETVIIIAIIFVVLLIASKPGTEEEISTTSTPERVTTVDNLPMRQPRPNMKTILTWNDCFGMKHFGIGVGQEPFIRQGCRVNNCELWHRLDPEPVPPHDQFDAVVFHGIDTGASSREDLPLVRSDRQRYIFSLLESPAMRPIIYNKKDFFNWTVTYRRDSDIVFAYTVFRSKGSGSETPVKVWRAPTFEDMSHVPDSVAKKPKLVAWFSSNSHSQSRRDKYVEKLAKYVVIDVYGEDKKLKCPRTENCDLMLERNYKFYLAFENSLCEDYATEKMIRPLMYNTVPVVYGGADYKLLAPPLSYIDVRDFESPRRLAAYLRYLHENPLEYRKYFWWQRFYTVHSGRSSWCELCERLNRDDEPRKVYPDIESWWIYPNVCRSPKEHFTRAYTPNMLLHTPS